MTEETRQDKRSHIDSVCAEFGDLASARERDFLFDELLPNEVVLVVIKGEVPFDPNRPYMVKGTGIGVATSQRALFLGHDAAGDRAGMLLPKAGIVSTSFDEDSFSSKVSVTSEDGIVYRCVDVLPKHAATRFVESLRSPDAGLEQASANSETDQNPLDARALELNKLSLLMAYEVISTTEFNELKATYDRLPAELVAHELPFSASDLLTEYQTLLGNGEIDRDYFNICKAAAIELSGLASKLVLEEIDQKQADARAAVIIKRLEPQHGPSGRPSGGPLARGADADRPTSQGGPDLLAAGASEPDPTDEVAPRVGHTGGNSTVHRSRIHRGFNTVVALVTICTVAVVAVVSFVALERSSDSWNSGADDTSGAATVPTEVSRATPQPKRTSAPTPTWDKRVFCSDDAYDIALKELQAFDMSPDSNVRGSQIAPVLLRMTDALDCLQSQHRSRFTKEKQCLSNAIFKGWLAMDRIGNTRLRNASYEDAQFVRVALDGAGQGYANCLIYS